VLRDFKGKISEVLLGLAELLYVFPLLDAWVGNPPSGFTLWQIMGMSWVLASGLLILGLSYDRAEKRREADEKDSRERERQDEILQSAAWLLEAKPEDRPEMLRELARWLERRAELRRAGRPR
jgi:hypothetical protein